MEHSHSCFNFYNAGFLCDTLGSIWSGVISPWLRFVDVPQRRHLLPRFWIISANQSECSSHLAAWWPNSPLITQTGALMAQSGFNEPTNNPTKAKTSQRTWLLSRPPRRLKLSKVTHSHFWSLGQCWRWHEHILATQWCKSTSPVHLSSVQFSSVHERPRAVPSVKATWWSVFSDGCCIYIKCWVID